MDIIRVYSLGPCSAGGGMGPAGPGCT
jgi:hypothetical protein